jgi:signal peptidase I
MRPIEIFLLISAVLLLVGLYKTFEKAGEKGWKAFVPVYNFLVWLKIIKKPWWWIFLILIPTVGFYMLAVMLVLLSNCFGKRKFIHHVLAVVGYFIWLPYLGFSKDVKFTGVPPEEKKKHWAKEWGEAGIFAVVAATLIRTFFFEAFVIPSSSMEGTLLVGDYLFVSKMSYGAKVPAVPLTVPFTHNTLPFTETTPSYFDWIELPYMRLPGFGEVERNDIVVFNFPEGDTVFRPNRNTTYYQVVREAALQNRTSESAIRQQMIDGDMLVVHPVDKEDNYVKRCVAIAGDRVEIKQHVLYVNGKPAYEPKNLQYGFFVHAPDLPKLENAIAANDIETEDPSMTNEIREMKFHHLLQCTAEDLKIIEPLCDSIVMSDDSIGQYDMSRRAFPHSDYFRWNKDNFGPLIIPKKGATVHLSVDSLPLWERIIRVYEKNTLEVRDGKFIINGQPATTYTFKQDYFWLMGDNRHNSLDSRFWGYVPADHVVGKPVFVWMSKGDKTGFRPERMMSFVSKDGLSKSYLWWVVGGIVLIVAYNQFKNRGKGKGNDKDEAPKLKVQTKKK